MQHLFEKLRYRHGSAAVLAREGPVDAVALRAPFVLDHDRARHRGHVAVEPGVAAQPPRQRAVERRDRDRIFHQGAGVGRPQFEGGVLQRGAQRPPDVARILDHAGPREGCDIGVEILASAKQFRDTRARQLVICGQPIALQPGRARAPERRGGGERDEQRQIGQHPRHHVDPVLAVRQLDMDVQPAQHVALADHLQIVHHRVVAVGRRLERCFPGRGRVRAGREDRKPVLRRDRRDRCPQMPQLRMRRRHVAMGHGRDLDLRLQHLAHELRAERRFGGGEKRLRPLLGNHLGLGIDQEIFLLDSDRIGIGHGRFP